MHQCLAVVDPHCFSFLGPKRPMVSYLREFLMDCARIIFDLSLNATLSLLSAPSRAPLSFNPCSSLLHFVEQVLPHLNVPADAFHLPEVLDSAFRMVRSPRAHEFRSLLRLGIIRKCCECLDGDTGPFACGSLVDVPA